MVQNTSNTWKSLLAAGARLETKAVIGGAEYTLMTNPVIMRALMQEALGIGNAVSATCQFSIQTTATIPRAAAVQIQMRLTDGETESEWLPAGTFFISRRQRDPVTGILTLECYDAMLKANAALDESWVWTTDTGDHVVTDAGDNIVFSDVFPCGGDYFVHLAAVLMGVELDSRTTLQTGSAYIIAAQPAGTTIHDVLCLIAAQNGGNWIITPDDKMRLVPLVSAADAEGAADDVMDVVGIVGGISQRTTATVTGIRYTSNDLPVILGDESGLVIDADVGAAVASDLYDALAGITYQAYALAGAIYDPAAELGDYVRAGANGEIRSMLCAEVATLGAMLTGDISAPEGGELSDEYPYIGGASNKALIASKAYTQAAVQSFSDSLNQESVFNRLTDNGAAQGLYMVDGQLYINMSYARAGTLILGGLNNQNGLLQVQDASGNTVGTWNNVGISIEKGSLKFPVEDDANNIIMLNGVDDVASYRRAFLIRYKQGSNKPIRTMIDRGEISIKTTSNSGSVSYGAVSIKPGKVLLSSDNAFSTVLVSLDGTTTYYDDGYMTTGTAKLYLYNGRIYLTYRNAETGSDVMWFDLNVFRQTMTLLGSATFGSVSAGNGASGTFTTADNKTVTVTNGIITGIA